MLKRCYLGDVARSSRKSPTTTDRQSTTVRSTGRHGLGDAASKQLAQLGKQGGNQALDDQLRRGAGMRDQLLAVICERLKNMHRVQTIEKLEMGREREWFKGVAKGKHGYHLPDPTRWHEAAELFRRAAQAMCSGNLGQGAALVDKALEAERAAYKSMPIMVRTRLDHTTKEPGDAPDVLAHVPTHSACPTTAVPQDVNYADRILAVEDVMEETPPLKAKRGNAWWLDEDEDEDEDEDDDG